MGATPSTMMALGTKLSDFVLPDTQGNIVSSSAFVGQPLLVMFICNHCPFVHHVAEELKRTGDEYGAKGMGIVAIMSNDIENYPDDAPNKMKQEKELRGYPFAYLFDEDQSVAKAFTATCTPDFFLFDAEHKLAYRGQLDETRPGSGTAAHGHDMRCAMDAILAGDTPNEQQRPSIGCNIKWKPGNEPAYDTHPI